MRFSPFLALLASASSAFADVVDVTHGAKAEAENGSLNGVNTASSTGGYSGSGYVQGFDSSGDSLTITVYSQTQALYDVTVRYAAIYGPKQTTLTLNGGSGAEVIFPDTTGGNSRWADASAGQFLLNQGNNYLKFTTDWGWYFIDYINVTPASKPASHRVSNSLVAPNPLPVTRALFNTLLSKYGTGALISGQAGTSDLQWVEQNVGKTPAILGLDMGDYSPSRVQYGATSTTVEDAIAFDGRNGIVAFQWHWNAPTDLINSAAAPWYSGFYTYATTFDVAAALASPGSYRYNLILRDMDAIATQLLRLQAKNIPVLWRPLHEAEGGWFWWGAKGPEPCKALYKLMFDRFTNYHGLRNLIWIWNSVSPAWYPGNNIVDILGYDSYPPVGDHGPVSPQYQALIALSGDTKMVTLPEVGNIPDPGTLKLYHADWSYFVTWGGGFIDTDQYNDINFKRKVYNDPTVIKLQGLGNWKGNSGNNPPPPPPPPSTSGGPTPPTSQPPNGGGGSGTQAKYGQCGGNGWTGPRTCVSGTSCVYSNDWYSQCL